MVEIRTKDKPEEGTAHHLLEHKENWDGEGDGPYSAETIILAEEVWKWFYLNEFGKGEIFPGPGTSIDITFEGCDITGTCAWLVNVRSKDDMSVYLEQEGLAFKGKMFKLKEKTAEEI